MGPLTQHVQLGQPYAPMGPLPILCWAQHHFLLHGTSLHGTQQGNIAKRAGEQQPDPGVGGQGAEGDIHAPLVQWPHDVVNHSADILGAAEPAGARCASS